MAGWGSTDDSDAQNARSYIAILRSVATTGLSTPGERQAFSDSLGHIGWILDSLVQRSGGDAEVARLRGEIAPILTGLRRDVTAGRMDPVNLGEDVKKLEEKVTQILRIRNLVGGRRKTRKGRRKTRRTRRRR